MIEIIPAILEPSLDRIEQALTRVRGTSPLVQIDIVDGVYAGNLTWPFATPAQRAEFERVAFEEHGLPLWHEFDFEADLMLARPMEHLSQWISAGFSRIVLHADSEDVLRAAGELQRARGEHSFALEVGIALPSAGEVSMLAPFLGLFQYVQVMGIARVGFQGEAFDERAVALARELRAENPGLTIQVDGGAGREHIRELATAGVNRIIEGHTIFQSDNPKKMIEELTAIANEP